MDTVAWLMFPSCKSMPEGMVSSNPKVSSFSTRSSIKMGIETVSVTGFTVAVVKVKSRGPGKFGRVWSNSTSTHLPVACAWLCSSNKPTCTFHCRDNQQYISLNASGKRYDRDSIKKCIADRLHNKFVVQVLWCQCIQQKPLHESCICKCSQCAFSWLVILQISLMKWHSWKQTNNIQTLVSKSQQNENCNYPTKWPFMEMMSPQIYPKDRILLPKWTVIQFFSCKHFVKRRMHPVHGQWPIHVHSTVSSCGIGGAWGTVPRPYYTSLLHSLVAVPFDAVTVTVPVKDIPVRPVTSKPTTRVSPSRAV